MKYLIKDLSNAEKEMWVKREKKEVINDMVEKSRDSYHANVKLAKSQVFEISAVFVCLFIILITIIGIS